MKKVDFFIAMLFLFMPVWAVGQESGDSITLGEVEVKGDAYVGKSNHVVLFLDRKNRNFGTNALDAVSSLSRFRDAYGASSLTNLKNEEVFILINGVPSTGNDLRGYQGDEVKNVEYYPVAPPKYMGFTKGPVVNVVMKRRVDRFYSGYLNAMDAVTTAWGNNMAVLTYADSLNQVKVTYNNSYRNSGSAESLSAFAYPGGDTSLRWGDDGRRKFNNNTLSAEYQYFNSRHIFNARASQTWHDGREMSPADDIIISGGDMYGGSSLRDFSTRGHSFALGLFYYYIMARDKALSVNVSNSFSRSWADNRLFRTGDVPEMDYDILNKQKNRNYRLDVNSILTLGRASVGAMYQYSRLTQLTPDNGRTAPSMSVGYVYGSMNFFFGSRNVIAPSVGLSVNSSQALGKRSTQVYPYLSVYAQMHGAGKLSPMSLLVSLTANQSTVGISELSSAGDNIDNRFIVTGNPYIKATWRTQGRVTLSYAPRSGRVYAEFTYQPQFNPRPFMPVISTVDGSTFYSFMGRCGDEWRHDVNMSVKWQATSWLTVSPFVEFHNIDYSTLSRSVDFSYWRAGGNLTFAYRGFQASLSANSRIKDRSGDYDSGRSAQYSVSIMWKRRTLSLGARLNHVERYSYNEAVAGDFGYYNRTHLASMSHLVTLTASWYFSRGKARQQPQINNNTVVDDGLRVRAGRD